MPILAQTMGISPDGVVVPTTTREIYDKGFLDASCNLVLVPLNKQTGMDNHFPPNTELRQSRFYLRLLLLSATNKSMIRSKRVFSFAYTVFTAGLSFGIAGVGPQVEVLNQYLLRIVAFLASMGLVGLLRVLLLCRQRCCRGASLVLVGPSRSGDNLGVHCSGW